MSDEGNTTTFPYHCAISRAGLGPCYVSMFSSDANTGGEKYAECLGVFLKRKDEVDSALSIILMIRIARARDIQYLRNFKSSFHFTASILRGLACYDKSFRGTPPD